MRDYENQTPILGVASIDSAAIGIPEEGLASNKLRVELAWLDSPVTGWIAELTVLDRLPWNRGERRRVAVRVMSMEFYRAIRQGNCRLLMKRGGDPIGILDF